MKALKVALLTTFAFLLTLVVTLGFVVNNMVRESEPSLAQIKRIQAEKEVLATQVTELQRAVEVLRDEAKEIHRAWSKAARPALDAYHREFTSGRTLDPIDLSLDANTHMMALQMALRPCDRRRPSARCSLWDPSKVAEVPIAIGVLAPRPQEIHENSVK